MVCWVCGVCEGGGGMSKQVRITEELFNDVIRLVDEISEYELDGNTSETLQRVLEGIRSKLEKVERREMYTRYKGAVDAGEKEVARQAYLNSVGMRESFRWGIDYAGYEDDKAKK